MTAALNITATNTSAPGFLTVWPCGQPRPLASNLNFVAGQTIPNLTITKLGASGKVCIYSMATTDVVADVAGSFAAGDDYTPIANPARILDTRGQAGGSSSNGVPSGPAGGPGCGLGAAAFCDTFDVATPGATPRGGDL